MDNSEISTSKVAEDDDDNLLEPGDLGELNAGAGWAIPDGNSTGSPPPVDVELASSKDRSQKVHESMFTDSDGGSTIKMNEQCHSDATQTGEEDAMACSHPVESKDNPQPSPSDPSNKGNDQTSSDGKEIGQFILTEKDCYDDDEMSEASDVVNNNKVRSPREISQEEQRSLLESLPSSSKLRTVTSSGSLFSEEGYQTFPGAEQSQELLKREVYGREEDQDSEAAISVATDTSNLAQLIVDHVLENVVGSIQDESGSDSSLREIVENLEQALEDQEKNESMDQGEEEEFLEDQEEEQVAEDQGQEEPALEKKEYASKMELDKEMKLDEEETTDFQLDEPQHLGLEVTERSEENMKDGDDMEVDNKLSEDNTVSSPRDRGPEGEQGMDKQHSPPRAENSAMVDKQSIKSLDTEGQPKFLKSKDSGVSVSCESGRNSLSTVKTSGESDGVSVRLLEQVVPADTLQEYDTQRHMESTDDPGAEKPYEDSTFKELTPEDVTGTSAEMSGPERLAYQETNGNLAYTAVSGYTNPSSIRADESSGFLAADDSQFSSEPSSSLGKAVQTPPRMVLRTKQEFIVNGNRPEQDNSQKVKGQQQQSQKEAEMLREQLILDKVRKDMAAKEKEMRRQIDREMVERMERARLQQELFTNGGEYYRSENDLSLRAEEKPTELVRSEPPRPTYLDSASSRSPAEAGMREVTGRNPSEGRMSEEDLLWQYQRELSRSEHREHRQPRQYDISGIDTYATLQNQHRPNDNSAREDQLRLDGMSYADISRDYGVPMSNIYSSYNIPPPQYNVSTSFGAQNSSHTSSDLEAPPPKSGSVPPFKTLHEQQIGWMRMFKTLEEQHHNELKNQYRQHQETIFSMQHQIESELLNQQQTLKQKLSAHKEALSSTASPIRSSADHRQEHSASQVLESTRLDNSHMYKESFSPKTSPRSRQMERLQRSEKHPSPPWKDIYREIRGKGIDSDRETEDNEEETTPIRRSLEHDFMSTSSMLRLHGAEEIPGPPRKSSELPRGGVFSSPMPILRKSNISHTNNSSQARQNDRSPPVVTGSSDLSQHSHHGDSRLSDSRLRDSSAEAPMDSMTSEERASQSHRAHLREKHAKHLSDLREYYEQEIHELRTALSRSDDITNRSPFKRVASENQSLITENHALKNANEEMESQLNKLLRENRELEQKLHGLERRACEYADCYKEAQDKISTFRDKVEELQYQNRTMEDQIQQQECQLRNQTDTMKHYKKAQEEQMDILQKDRNAYHKLSDKYDIMEREFNMLKESFNSTENKLYDARSEVLELNRTISKLELENKRIGRENDNLRYKLTQSANAVTVQGNNDTVYCSPSQPGQPSPNQSLRKPDNKMTDTREGSHIRSRSQEIPVQSLADNVNHCWDREGATRGHGVNSFSGERETPCRVRERSVERRPKNNCDNYDEVEEIEKSRQRPKSAPGSRSVPERQTSPGVEQTSPVLRAERELYKLREIMRQADQTVESPSRQPPKLQKKFYGSESGLSIDQSDSGTSIHKSDSSSSLKFKKKKSVSSSPVKSPKVRTSKLTRYPESDSSLSQAKFETSPSDFDTPTRFDISASNKSASRRQHGDYLPTRDTGSKPGQSAGSRDRRNGEVRGSKSNRDRKTQQAEKDTQVPNGTVERTLNKVREGEYLSRPGWEDVYTSMAKPKTDSKVTPVKQTVKNRIDSISDLEARYDELQTEKRTLESKLSRVPTHGKGRQQQENLEEKLDDLEKELGSVRMSLKRYHVLKTSI